jgi:DNA uptake protein ComE-like DNA-binding protein
MRRENGWLSLRTIVVALGVLMFVVGASPVFEFLYWIGLYPQVQASEVEARLKRHSPNDTVTCHEGTGGWDFICEQVHRRNTGATSRHKYGIMGSWMSPVASIDTLPVDQPTPADRNAFRRTHAEAAAQERTRLTATLDLNRARVDQLTELPGIDEATARRITIAVIRKRFTTVDDLLAVEGMTQEKVDRIRTLVRVDP